MISPTGETLESLGATAMAVNGLEFCEPGMPEAAMILDSPIGALRVVTDGEALLGMYLENVTPPEAMWVPGPHSGQTRWFFSELLAQLQEYFEAERKKFELKVAPFATDFEALVWRGLATIAYGETVSYADLAERIGRPGAQRAVGQANGRNPIALVVPCHRVIASDGTLGGYGGGLPTKSFLLELEGAHLAGNSVARGQHS